MKIGVLAYGSLIDDPGPELRQQIVSTLKNVATPFPVEYARSSQSRGGAPTLIPVDTGGAKVTAAIHVLKDGVTAAQAADWIWRRETRKYGPGEHYDPSKRATRNRVRVETLSDLHGVDTVLYTRIGANIPELNAEELARLAVQSARDWTVDADADGISYLMRAKDHGIITALTPEYEKAILRLAGCPNLRSALNHLRRPAVVRAFCEDCVWAKAVRRHFTELFEAGDRRHALLQESAATFFHDLNIVLLEYVLLQQYKLVDAASSGKEKDNLTSNYILGLEWTAETRRQLQTQNDKLLVFKAKIGDARRKLVAHADLRARLGTVPLGAFLEVDEQAFWAALQEFANAAHEEAIGGPFEIDTTIPDGDAVSLLRRLAEAVDYDDLLKEEPALLQRVVRKRFERI